MSKLNKGLYSSESHTWQTPPELVNALLAFEGVESFDLDPACSTNNIPAYMHHYHPDFNGLALPWNGLVFLNPPYNTIKDWVKKAYEESLQGAHIWALLPARTETRYQHDYGLTKAGFTVFLRGRLRFLQNGVNKGTAPFPTMLLYFGDDWMIKAQRWAKEQPLQGTLMFRGKQ